MKKKSAAKKKSAVVKSRKPRHNGDSDIAEQVRAAELQNLKLIAAGSPVVVAEGDSWFNLLLFGPNLIENSLRQWFFREGYAVVNYAFPGDTLEEMIFGHQSCSVLAAIDFYQPKVFVFSGGGNDIVGDEFGNYLNHADSGQPPLRKEYAEYIINTVFRGYLDELIKKVTRAYRRTRLVMHGYGYGIPTGKGIGCPPYWFGPWLLPALLEKGITDPAVQRGVVRELIDMYNEMLDGVQRAHQDVFYHVDLRRVIARDSDWSDELHLKQSAIRNVRDKMTQVIKPLL